MLYIDSIELHSACFVKIHVQKIITHNITCLWSLFMCSHSKYVNAVTVSTITFHAVSFLRTHTTWHVMQISSYLCPSPAPHARLEEGNTDLNLGFKGFKDQSSTSFQARIHQFDSVWLFECRRVSPSVAECQTLFWNQIEVSSQQAFRFNHAYLLEQINSKNRSITVALGLALLNWSCPLLCKEHTYIIIQYPDKENRNGGLSLLKLT